MIRIRFLLLGSLCFLLGSVGLQAQQFTITNQQLVSSVRISLYQYDYTYQITAENTGPNVATVACVVTSTTPQTIVRSGNLTFGDMPSGSTATSTTTLVLRQDRRYAFSWSNLHWQWSSNSAPWDLYINRLDQDIAGYQTSDGEILQVLSQKDSNGIPIRLTGFTKFNPTNVAQADTVSIGDNNLPESVALRNGSKVTFAYLPGSQVAITVAVPNVQPMTVVYKPNPIHPSATQNATSTADASLVNAPSLQAANGPTVYVEVARQMGNTTVPIGGASVYVTWGPSLNSSEPWSTSFALPPGVGAYNYSDVLPYVTEPEDPQSIEQKCKQANTLILAYCTALKNAGFGPSEIGTIGTLGCPYFLTLGPSGPLLAAACEAGVIATQFLCNTPGKFACSALLAILDQNAANKPDMLVTVSVRTPKNENRTQTQGWHSSVSPNVFFEFIFPGWLYTLTWTATASGSDVYSTGQDIYNSSFSGMAGFDGDGNMQSLSVNGFYVADVDTGHSLDCGGYWVNDIDQSGTITGPGLFGLHIAEGQDAQGPYIVDPFYGAVSGAGWLSVPISGVQNVTLIEAPAPACGNQGYTQQNSTPINGVGFPMFADSGPAFLRPDATGHSFSKEYTVTISGSPDITVTWNVQVTKGK